MSEWEEGRILIFDQTGLCFACESAGDMTGGRVHSPARFQFVFLLNSSMSPLPTETQRSQWNVGGADRRERILFSWKKTTSLSGTLVCDPARCAHLPGNEL